MSRAIHKMRGGIAQIVIVGTVTGNVSSINTTTHSLGNIDVGAANTDKNAIMLITHLDNFVFGRSVVDVTIGGVSLAVKASIVSNGDDPVGSSIWAGDISSKSGSQAIQVVMDADTQSVGASGVAISGLQSLTPTMTDTDTTGSGAQLTATNLAALLHGIAVGCGCSEGLGSSPTWGSLTKRADVGTGGSGIDDHKHTAAWDLGLRVAADETLDFTSGTDRTMAVAGFR